jgi:hypothetical protein
LDGGKIPENTLYYGLQGCLATITSADEAKISGEQAAGADGLEEAMPQLKVLEMGNRS